MVANKWAYHLDIHWASIVFAPKWEVVFRDRHYLPSNTSAGSDWLIWLLPCLARLVAKQPAAGDPLLAECAIERLVDIDPNRRTRRYRP